MRRTWTMLAIGLWLLGQCALAVAEPTTRPSPQKPTKLVVQESCVTAECHAGVKNFKVLHGPVNVNACDACHKVKSETEHTFELTRNKTETCTFCHKMETPEGNHQHKPFAEGQCLGCHDPHGGTNKKFFRGTTLADMCIRCHQDAIKSKKAVHGPVAAGACDSCHTSHSAKFPKLLAVQGKDLCLSCHAEMKTQLTQVKFVHKALEQDCNKCHDPHSSDFPMQTKSAPEQLCTSCHEHEKVKQAAADAPHKHSVVTDGKACLNCHNAHGGNLAKLMKAQQVDVCMKCHVKPQTAADKRKIPAVAEVLDKSKPSKHGPIRDGDCGGCHNPHGSEQAKLLAKPYPDTFYQAFAIEKYDLCFKCHDKQLVTAEKTPGLTKFRNGETNLHYLHVNKQERGRSCRACHETHASEHDLHVRDTVPYGNWKLPINFKKTETGGSCAPGCHKSFSYDRDNPVTPPEAPEPKEAKP